MSVRRNRKKIIIARLRIRSTGNGDQIYIMYVYVRTIVETKQLILSVQVYPQSTVQCSFKANILSQAYHICLLYLFLRRLNGTLTQPHFFCSRARSARVSSDISAIGYRADMPLSSDSSVSYTCIEIAVPVLPRSSIFILVEVLQCQGLCMFKIRSQTDIVTLESRMGRPSPSLLTFRA